MPRQRKLIAGNWKMTGWQESWQQLAAEVAAGAPAAAADLLVCPPFPGLPLVADILSRAGGQVALGAQDVHHAAEGAYTGDVSARMLKELGCHYVIVGHSERREGHGETNAQVAAKAVAAMAGGLVPIVCVGELERANASAAAAVLRKQLRQSLAGVQPSHENALVVAYEPVWAIGSGQTPTSADIATVHEALRAELGALFGAELAAGLRLLYGGSLKPANAAEILSIPDVDGGLIGGASLQAESFLAIAAAAQQVA